MKDVTNPTYDDRINHSQGVDSDDLPDAPEEGPSPDPWDFDGSIDLGWDW